MGRANGYLYVYTDYGASMEVSNCGGHVLINASERIPDLTGQGSDGT